LKQSGQLGGDKLSPASDPAAFYRYLCRALVRGGDYQSAVAAGEEGLKRDANNAKLHNTLGNAYYSWGRFDLAARCYSKAVELDKTGQSFDQRGVMCANLADAYLEQRKFKEALAAIEEAIALEPANGRYHCTRGRVLADGLQDYEGGIKSVKKAIDLDPECEKSWGDGSYYFFIATYLERLNKPEEAVVFAEKALKFKPDSARYKRLKEGLGKKLGPGGGQAPLSPRYTFADVGGMKALKDELRRVMNVVLVQREKAKKYDIERNGILLYGPPGCGKTFFAEAVAGEFGMKFMRVSLASIVSKWIGESSKNMEVVFQDAVLQCPCLLFFDEFESIAARRGQEAHHIEDQRTVDAFLQQIDNYRRVPNLIIAAATNHLEELDAAAIREGRFDYKVAIRKPDFDARLEILKVKLRTRPLADDIDYFELANKTEGFSTARLTLVINNAALMALDEDAPITHRHLLKALDGEIGKDKYDRAKKTWDDLILDPATKKKLRFIEEFIEHPEAAKALGIDPPSGLLLSGPPGTGKTTIARVLASQIKASFYLVSPADVFRKWLGESEQAVKDIFEKARDNQPSVIFIDEIDALLSRRGEDTVETRNSVVNLFLMEIDGLASTPGVFVMGATNRPDLLDTALLRPGRLSEHVEIPPPSEAERGALFKLFCGKMKLAADVDLPGLARQAGGFTGADIEEICHEAGRKALIRLMENPGQPPAVCRADFDAAMSEKVEALKSREAEPKRMGFAPG
ncbi:MAG: AAA family ATPase, partial [Elusimicrobia bacterium]|nr:AAA family ATPase [Elusimicrobiota bacterium]